MCDEGQKDAERVTNPHDSLETLINVGTRIRNLNVHESVSSSRISRLCR